MQETQGGSRSDWQGSEVVVKDEGEVEITIDGFRLRHVFGYKINRWNPAGQPVLELAIPVRSLNERGLVSVPGVKTQ